MSKTKKYIKKSLRKTNKKIRKKISNKHRKKHHKKSVRKYSKKRTLHMKKKGGERALGKFFGVKSRCNFDRRGEENKESLNELYELCKKKSRTNKKGEKNGCQNRKKKDILKCKDKCCYNPFFFFEDNSEDNALRVKYKKYSIGNDFDSDNYSGKFDAS